MNRLRDWPKIESVDKLVINLHIHSHVSNTYDPSNNFANCSLKIIFNVKDFISKFVKFNCREHFILANMPNIYDDQEEKNENETQLDVMENCCLVCVPVKRPSSTSIDMPKIRILNAKLRFISFISL